MYKILNPQPTIENPYIVEDYPYGWNMRTQMRVYTEYRPKMGMRYTTQTLNPKTGKWNAPKSGTYSKIVIVYQDPVDGHIHPKYFSGYEEKELKEFVEFAGDILNQSPYMEVIKFYTYYFQMRKVTPVNMTITTTTYDGQHTPTREISHVTLLDGKIISEEKEN